MQFSNFSRTQDGLVIILYNDQPIENVGTVKNYSDNSSGTFSKKEFRWSFNNEYWSAWETLTRSAISRINTLNNYYFFLQVRYTLSSASSGTVTTFAIDYTQGTASPTVPTVLTHDIQISDSTSVLIHDILQKYEITSITDASTLNGYAGSYYLNRAHHKGYQPISSITGLQSVVNQVTSYYSYIDGSIILKLSEASLGSNFVWNASGYLDVSVVSMNYDYIDGSLVQRDLSINNLYSTKQNLIFDGTYLKESSIGSGFTWNAGMLDVSSQGDVTKE